MIFTTGLRRIASATAAAAFLACVLLFGASAQEISASHMKAARAAVDALNVTDAFDNILPSIAGQLKVEFIQSRPDMQEVIQQTVDAEAIALAGRRVDLENEVATAYARALSEEDLTAIAAFYNTPAGQKLMSEGPIVLREMEKAADIWRRGMARDLSGKVAEKLDKISGAMAPSATVTPGSMTDPATQTPQPEQKQQ